MNNPALFLSLRLTSAFLMLFLWLFLPHRYKKAVSLCIVFAGWLLAALPEVTIGRHVAQAIDLTGVAALAAEALLALGTAMLLGEHRDSRSLFVGLSACTYSLAAYISGSLVYFHLHSPVLAMLGQSVFSVAVLLVLCANNRMTPLSALLADEKGRWQLCFIPFICFVSILVASIWPGNVFTIPVCRLISVIMILLMFLYYHLVIVLLRTQMNNCWLNSNRGILGAYVNGLKYQIEHMKDSQEEIAILRHDIRHRANLVQYYLDEGNTDAVREMFAQVNARLDATVEVHRCEDSALDWILSDCAKKSAERGVRFECTAEVPPLPEKLELEFGTVVLNLLENATHAVAKLQPEERFIRFTARLVKGQLFLCIDNSYAGTLRFSPDTGLPLSEQGGGHGYGLRSVLAFAKTHGATFDCTAQDGVFHARLLFLLPAEK